jgi:hypothetical protein
MDKLRELDMRYQKIHQERLKLERKMKIKEAQDIQNNVLHSKTLENELRIIERQKEVAQSRNEKILTESLVKVNDLNEKISKNSLIQSKNRLKNAKFQYYEVVIARYPDWEEVIKDPESFQTRKLEEGLLKLRQLQEKNEEDHKKKLESQKLRMLTSEQLRSGFLHEEELSKLREKSLKENEIKIEQERLLLRSQHELARAQDISKHEEMMKDLSSEVFSEHFRISTPNTHIPNVFHLNRPKQERPYVPEHYAGSFPDVQRFVIDRPSSVGVERKRTSSTPKKSPKLDVSNSHLQIYPQVRKEKNVFVEEKKVKKSESIESPGIINRPENFSFGAESFQGIKNKINDVLEVKAPVENFEYRGHVDSKTQKEQKVLKVESSKNDFFVDKSSKVEFSQPEIPSLQIYKNKDLKNGQSLQNLNQSKPLVVNDPKPQKNDQRVPVQEEKISQVKLISKIIETSDEDTPSSLRVPSHAYVSVSSKIPELPENSNSESNEFESQLIELPDNSVNPKILKQSEFPRPVTFGNPVNPIKPGLMSFEEDFDTGIQIIKGPPPKLNERRSIDEESSKVLTKKSETPKRPDSGKKPENLKIETKKLVSKVIEIDDEFEIKTVNNSKNLKVPEVNIEESLEDSSQLDNDYLKGFMDRTSQSKTSSKIDSSSNKAKEEPMLKRELSSKTSLKEEPVLRKDSSTKHFGSTTGEPLSPSAVSSNTAMFEIKMMATNKVLNSIQIQQRRMSIKDLFNLLRDRLKGTGFSMKNFQDELKMQRVEKLYENYLMSKNQTKFKHNEELLGFILNLAKTLPDCFLPSELARSKIPFTEFMIREKMRGEYFNIYADIKEFLVEALRESWLNESMIIDIFVDTVVNFRTSKNQFDRCRSCLGKIIKADMSRPPTSNKDQSVDLKRVVTPNDRQFEFNRVVTPGERPANSAVKGSMYAGSAWNIEDFKETIDDY